MRRSEAMKIQAQVREIFNTVSQTYDSEALRFFATSAESLSCLLGLRGDEQALDVATGTGNLALAMARQLPHGFVTGIDFSTGMLDRARAKAAEQQADNVEFLHMDMQRLRFAHGTFDTAASAFGLFFADNLQHQLRQMVTRVRRGGTVAISGFQEDYFRPLSDLFFGRLAACGVRQQPRSWKQIATESGCRQLFAQAGLHDVRVSRQNLGYYLSDAEAWWEVVWNAGFRRLVNQLPRDEQRRFREQHLAEAARLATDRGIWLDVRVLYAVGVRQ